MEDKTVIVKDTINDVLKITNELGYTIIKCGYGEYRLCKNGVVIFRVWDNKEKTWEINGNGKLKTGYTKLIIEIVKDYLNINYGCKEV